MPSLRSVNAFFIHLGIYASTNLKSVCGGMVRSIELISKLNFMEEEDQEPSNLSSNPFDEPDDPNDLNPFGDLDEEGRCNSTPRFFVRHSFPPLLLPNKK